MKSDVEKEQEELKNLLKEADEIKRGGERQEQVGQTISDIGKAFKGGGALVFLIVMLVLVVKKIANIKMVNASGWIVLGVSFFVISLLGVNLSDRLEKKTNLSEKVCMNISILGLFIIFGGIVYLFWDSVSKFF